MLIIFIENIKEIVHIYILIYGSCLLPNTLKNFKSNIYYLQIKTFYNGLQSGNASQGQQAQFICASLMGQGLI